LDGCSDEENGESGQVNGDLLDEFTRQLDRRFCEFEERLARIERWIETLESGVREMAEQARRRKIEGED
jgi:hypothetical protein